MAWNHPQDSRAWQFHMTHQRKKTEDVYTSHTHLCFAHKEWRWLPNFIGVIWTNVNAGKRAHCDQQSESHVHWFCILIVESWWVKVQLMLLFLIEGKRVYILHLRKAPVYMPSNYVLQKTATLRIRRSKTYIQSTMYENCTNTGKPCAVRAWQQSTFQKPSETKHTRLHTSWAG